jgi:carbamoyl-phosphate synthase large subunit
MGMDTTFDLAFAKAHLASGSALPTSGRLYVATGRKHVRRVGVALRTAHGLGFEILAAAATVALLAGEGVTASTPAGGEGADALERLLASRQISLAVSISGGADADGEEIQRTVRAEAARHGVPYVTTVWGLLAFLRAVRVRSKLDFGVRSLQELHADARHALVARPSERVRVTFGPALLPHSASRRSMTRGRSGGGPPRGPIDDPSHPPRDPRIELGGHIDYRSKL